MTEAMVRGMVRFGAVLSIVTAGACSDGESSGHAHEDLTPDCDAIMRACHLLDVGDPNEIHECHELAHHNQASACSSRRDRCVGVCVAASDAGMD